MPDREYKIRIVTVSDPSGAQQSSSALSEVTRETEKSTEANKEHGHSFIHAESAGRQFHKILHAITEESGPMGLALRAAISPQVALLTGVIMALHAFKKAQEEAAEAAKKAAEEAAEAYAKTQEAARAMREEAVESSEKFKQQFEDLAKAQHEAKENTAKITEAINTQKEALENLLKAQEKMELAGATTEQQKRDIKLKYGEKEQALATASELDALNARKQELAKAEQEAPVLLEKREEAEAKASGPEGQARSAAIIKQEAEVKRLQAQQTKPMLPEAKQVTAYLYEQAQAELERLHKEAADRKNEVERARKAELENETLIQKGRAEIPLAEAKFGVRTAGRQSSSSYEEAANLFEQDQANMKQLGKAGAAGDIFGIVGATIELSKFPAKMAALMQAISANNQSLDDAIATLNARTKSTINP